MEYRSNIWFSPRKILIHYFDKEKLIGPEIRTSQKYKVIREAYAVAIALLGIQKYQDKEYWLQLVDPKEQTPDIRTASIEEETNMLNVADIEVVTLEDHSPEGVEDFLKRTKLSVAKRYPKNTTILCYVEKNLYIRTQKEISDTLSEIKIENHVWLLGQIDPENKEYQLAFIHPGLGPVVHFKMEDEMFKPATDLIFTKRSTKKERIKTNEKCDPF